MKKRVVLIGPGRLGLAMARLLRDADYDIRAIISRNQQKALSAARFANCRQAATTDLSRARDGEIVLIALPDDHIEEMAATLHRKGYLAEGAVLVHFSGIHNADILLSRENSSVKGLSIHPLQTFGDSVVGVRHIPGSPFSLEGPDELIPLGKQLVEDVGGIPFRIRSEQKPLYHAAACVASNYMVTLVSTACQIMAACGFEEKEAFGLLSSLLRGTGKNMTVLGPELALTGPIVRGDAGTVAKHRKALLDLPEDIQEIYRVLGKKTVEVALKSGRLTEEKAEEILHILE